MPHQPICKDFTSIFGWVGERGGLQNSLKPEHVTTGRLAVMTLHGQVVTAGATDCLTPPLWQPM